VIRPTLMLIALAAPAAVASSDVPLTARSRALDGDTVAIDLRLLGVDAFERRQLCARDDGCWPCGKAAQDYAARLLDRGEATVTLTPARTYGRPVARVAVGGVDLGEALIGAGLAIPEPRYLQDMPSLARRYALAYGAARGARRGAHAGRWIAPARWRQGERLACEAGDRR
jgi:micrococcal nuclease